MHNPSPTDHELELRLAGRLRLITANGVEVTPRGRKARGLLALIGVAPGLRRSRAFLQDKLWSDRTPEKGSGSLRQEIARLRRLLGKQSRCIIADGDWVGFDPALVHVSLDPQPGDWELDGSPPEFADGLDVEDSEFEDWLRDQRMVFADRMEAMPPPPAEPIRPYDGPIAPDRAMPSIAVMPLTLLGDPGEGSFVATGLALDVIGQLTRFRRLDVIAFASTASLANRNLTPREIAQRLGARYLAQGTLRFGPRMRLTFELIEPETERMLWSQGYQCASQDVFEVEAEMAASVASALMVEIDQLERKRVRARNPQSLAAYELCIRGLDEMLRLEPSGCEAALKYFDRASGLEQNYARALSGVSRAYGFQWKYRWAADRKKALATSEVFALRAVEADAADPGANAGLGWVALYRRDHDRSIEAYFRAIELNPGDADILAEYADALKHSGSPQDAIPLFERAVRLNPYKADHYLKDLAHTFLVSGQYEAAIRTVKRMRRPHLSMRVLAASYALAGEHDAARRTAEVVRRASPDFSSETWITMVPDRDPNYSALYLEGMKLAGL